MQRARSRLFDASDAASVSRMQQVQRVWGCIWIIGCTGGEERVNSGKIDRGEDPRWIQLRLHSMHLLPVLVVGTSNTHCRFFIIFFCVGYEKRDLIVETHKTRPCIFFTTLFTISHLLLLIPLTPLFSRLEFSLRDTYNINNSLYTQSCT